MSAWGQKGLIVILGIFREKLRLGILYFCGFFLKKRRKKKLFHFFFKKISLIDSNHCKKWIPHEKLLILEYLIILWP